MMSDNDHAITDDLCSALRAWRIRSRLRQDAIAKCLGVAQSQISRWESGRDLPRPQNIEAIRRLIWGPEADPLLALRHFVSNSTQQLLLFDHEQKILARSLPYQASPNLLDRFGWVLDSAQNPAFGPVHERYKDLLQSPGGVIAMAIKLPFVHEGAAWVASLNTTIHSIAGVRVCLAELIFAPAVNDDIDVRVQEVRLDSLGDTRHSLTLWRQPPHQS